MRLKSSGAIHHREFVPRDLTIRNDRITQVVRATLDAARISAYSRHVKRWATRRPSAELAEFFNLGAGQVERYEISSYENLIDMADELGHTEAVELLERDLQEEKAALNTLKMFASEFDVAEETDEPARR